MKNRSPVEKKEVIIDPVLLEKVMVSGRVPRYVKKYAELNKLSISDLISAGFDVYRERDKEHAIERLRYHKERVLHWEGVVLQDEHMCNTEHVICNTIREEFRRQERGRPENKRQDEEWLIPRVRRLQAEGHKTTLTSLYKFCTSDENNGGKKHGTS